VTPPPEPAPETAPQPAPQTASTPGAELREARRQLLLGGFGIAASGVGFGLVLGLAARNAGLSPIEVAAMSAIVFAGASQFTAIGALAGGVPWVSIVVITFFINARHLLYSAAIAPALQDVPAPRRAVMAHFLTDESFALASAHFRRLGRSDEWGYWVAAVAFEFIPWNVSTIAGSLLGGAIPDPSVYGLDVVFPAAMAGLCLGLVTGRREAVAAGAGAAIGVVLSLVAGTQVGLIAGGLLGPLVAMALPGSIAGLEPASSVDLTPDGMA
jgi:4-azaleucine resistance transporter AzlC